MNAELNSQEGSKCGTQEAPWPVEWGGIAARAPARSLTLGKVIRLSSLVFSLIQCPIKMVLTILKDNQGMEGIQTS